MTSGSPHHNATPTGSAGREADRGRAQGTRTLRDEQGERTHREGERGQATPRGLGDEVPTAGAECVRRGSPNGRQGIGRGAGFSIYLRFQRVAFYNRDLADIFVVQEQIATENSDIEAGTKAQSTVIFPWKLLAATVLTSCTLRLPGLIAGYRLP